PLINSAPPCSSTPPLAPTQWFVGGVGFLSNSDDKNDTYTAKLTNVLGPIELKYGTEYANIEYTDDQAYSGKPIDFQFPIDADGDGTFSNASPDCSGPNPPSDCYFHFPSTSGGLADFRATGNYRVTRARFYPTPPPTKNK